MPEISLILPYWQRQDATDKAMHYLEHHNQGVDYEVILVDDGNEVRYKRPPRINMRIIQLPEKSGPLNPCVPYNCGVEQSTGEYVALSNPENIHRTPILDEMRKSIKNENDYVMAACWCPEQNRWHCHSSMNRRNDNDVGKYLPPGSNYHFMSMMHRSLWDKIGGFDEEYREGAGYDDPDLVRRLHKAKANFIMRDDLIVDHQRSNAHAAWTDEMFARNRALFESKWEPLNPTQNAYYMAKELNNVIAQNKTKADVLSWVKGKYGDEILDVVTTYASFMRLS